MCRNLQFNFFIAALVLLLAGGAKATDIRYARYPALSPDGATVAFTYRGDIWLAPTSGGEAKRLTVHEAEDILPQFSPDGKRVAFSSRRHDNYDVYVMPVSGGEPTQVTFNTQDDIVSGWTPQSDSILFMSQRDGRGDIFKVAAGGGVPIKLTGDYYERECGGKLSSSGRYLAFFTGSGYVRWWRRDLKTGGNSDIFLWDRSQPDFATIRLTSSPTHELWPVINEAASEVYYVANYDDTWAQVYSVPLTGGNPVRLTNFAGDGVQWLNSTPDGSRLIFEQDFRLWTLDPSDPQAQPQEIKLVAASDDKENRVERKSLSSEVEWFSLSPDDKKIAAVMFGDIFVIPADDPKQARRVTTTEARETYPEWGPNSRTIYYASERNGNYDIYKYDFTTDTESQLTNTPESETKPLPSPDGKYLVFYRATDKIIRYDLTTDKETDWVDGNFIDFPIDPSRSFDWAPDSKHLAFVESDPTHDLDIFVASLDGDIENVSQFINWNYRPRFSPDGKMIYFSSWTRWGEETYEIDLTPKPVEFDEASVDSLFLQSREDKKDEDDGDANTSSVKIDTYRIAERRHKAFPIGPTNTTPVMTPDGKTYLFIANVLGKPEIWSIGAEKKDNLTQLTHSKKAKDDLQVTSDSGTLYYLEDKSIRKLDIATGKSEKLDFAAEKLVDRVKLNKQKFFEGWRMLAEYFYDPTYRGADWKAARDKYARLLDDRRTEIEFGDIMMEMMGELRGSHMYYYDQIKNPSRDDETGRLGISFDYGELEKTGAYRVASVLHESPAERAGIKPGQYVTAVNGDRLSGSTNIAKLLNGTVGDRVMLEVSSSPTKTGTEVAVKPVNYATWNNLEYEDWVEHNRHLVDSLSRGRLAYLHIKAMNQPALDRFEEEIVTKTRGKDALIVDVRENGGGWIAVHLLGMLERKPYIMRTFRDTQPVSENMHRSKAWENPMALLINNYSGSNSEIFTEGFRKLKLGPIIGTPTGSGVIGTSQYHLLDGSEIRRPSWGSFTVDMKDTDLQPRQPDIMVERLPHDYLNHHDPQLVRAVQELMKQLDSK